jgi:hypothetical protein
MAIPKLNDLSFDNIELAKPAQKYPQFTVLYGKGGVGKTTLASYSENPVIVPVGRETGHEIHANWGIPTFANTQERPPLDFLFACIARLLKTAHSRKTLIIDNLGTYREAVDEDVEEDNKGNDKLDSFGKRQALCYPYYTRLLAGFDALMKKKEMNIILIAHEVLHNVNKEDGTYYSRTGIHAPAGQNTNVRALLEARAHNVLYLKLEPQTRKAKDSMGQEKLIATGGAPKRIIYTKPHSSFFAKCRVNMEPFYEIESSDNEEDLFKNKINQDIINFWNELYR